MTGPMNPLRALGTAARGTPLREWDAFVNGLPEADTSGWTNVVVLSPHPDDETLGFGGTISALARRGSLVTVLLATDGEGSHPHSPTVGRDELVRIRIGEIGAALRTLGVAPAVRLRLPDGALSTRHTDLVAALEDQSRGPGAVTHLATTSRTDGHPDHEACGRAAAEVADRLGIELLEFPVWTWHWARPTTIDTVWRHPRRIPLGADEQSAKADAVRCYLSQIAPLSDDPRDAPILPPHVLERLTTAREVVV